jgi:(p)ppGpp synthase/HD superfamily hydrolase
MINKAIEIATLAHYGQYRKLSGFPYIIHPLRVADNINLPDDIITSAAILHDSLHGSLEDCDTTKLRGIWTLIKSLDETVLSIVDELTKPINQNKSDYLKSFSAKSVRSLIIKIYDRIDNINDFKRFDGEKALNYFKSTHDLFVIFYNRQNEIIEFAGGEFFSRTSLIMNCNFT